LQVAFRRFNKLESQEVMMEAEGILMIREQKAPFIFVFLLILSMMLGLVSVVV
jgi:hypothetical protein